MEHSKSYVYFVSLIAALSGLLFGLDTGVISGALPHIQLMMHVHNLSELGLIVSILLFGAIVGSVISSSLSRWLGRKVVIVVAALLFTVCAVLSALAISVIFLIIVRFFLGIAVGMTSFIAPVYLSEISPKQYRGGIVAKYQLMITIGLFMAFIIDTIFDQWQWMLGVVAIPSVVLLILTFWLPQSPRWLILKGYHDRAKAIIAKISPSNEVEFEYRAIVDSFSKQEHAGSGVLKQRLIFLIGLGLALQMLQQWTGINAIMYYAPLVFKSAGFTSLHQQMWCTILVGVVNVLTTLIAIRFVDRWGRRPILLGGMSIMFIALCFTVYAMKLSSGSDFNHILAVVSVLGYIFGFAVSLGPIVWIVCVEIFPLRYRDFGVMATTLFNWLFNFILAQNFPILISKLGGDGVFALFGVITAIGIILVYFVCPETKGVSLEDIESNIIAGKSLRRIGVS